MSSFGNKIKSLKSTFGLSNTLNMSLSELKKDKLIASKCNTTKISKNT